MPRIDPLLLNMIDAGASDLHLVVGQKPKYRVDAEVLVLEDQDELSESMMEEYLLELLSDEQRESYLERHDLDLAYAIEDKARYRVNYFFQRTGYGAVFRLIPSTIMTIDELQLPQVLKTLCELRGGIVIAAGPTGSGKTTTLAAMLNHINETQRRHVLTIEDPVEFVHPHKKSIIAHRQVGSHTHSFANALRGVSRQDADVVLVGEMRDREAMSLALSAASMGILVFGTLHTNSALKTIDRIIDTFGADEQAQVRTMLAESLRGVVAQQLMRRVGGGRIAAAEVLIGNAAVANIVREGRIERLASVLQSGKSEGMQIMDDTLYQMVNDELIEPEDAYLKASDKSRFEKLIDQEKLVAGAGT